MQSTRLPTKMSMFSVDEEIANAPLSALLSITAEEGDLLPIPKGAARGLSTMLVDTRDVADSRQRQDQGHGAATGAATTTTAGVPLPSGLPPRGGGAPTSASGMQRRASLSDRAPSLSKFRASSLDFDKDLDELVAEHALESMKLGRNDSLWLLNAQSDATHLDNLLRSNSIDPSLASLLQPQGGGGGGNGHHRGDGQHYVSPLMQALSLSHPSWSLNSSLALAASLGVPSQQQQQQQLQLQQQQQQVQQQQQTATAAQPAAGPPAGQSADAATATLPAGATLPAAATATQPSALISAQLAEEAVAPAAPPRPAGVLLSPFTAAAADDGESGGAFTGVQLEKAPALNATSGLSRLDTVDTLLSTAMALSEMQPSSSPEAILGATPPPDAMLGARLTADLVPGVPGVPVGPQPQGAAALASWNHTPTPPLRTDALVLPVAPPLSIPATTRHLMPEKGAYTGGPQPGPGAMGSTCKIAAARADSGALFNFDEM